VLSDIDTEMAFGKVALRRFLISTVTSEVKQPCKVSLSDIAEHRFFLRINALLKQLVKLTAVAE